MSNLTLKAKLFILMALALLSLLTVGGIGWNGIMHVSEASDEVGKVRMPSINGLWIVNEAQTAIRSTNRLAAFYENDYNASGKFANVVKIKEQKWKEAEKGWKIYESLPQTKEEETLWKQFVQEWGAWKSGDAKMTEIINAMSQNTSGNAKDIEKHQKELFVEYYKQMDGLLPLYSKAEESLNKLVDLNVKYGDDAIADADADVVAARRNMLTGSIALLAIMVLLGTWITRSILGQLGGEPAYVADVVKRIADGDLAVQVQTKANDNSSMLHAVKGMVEKLSQTIGEVRGAADALSSASEQVSATAQNISQATSEQAASVEETSSSIEQMSASISQNTENAKVTNGMASQAAKQAAEGGEAVTQTVSAMKQIAGKIGIVDDIAYQTNLLALNAAIEAARAGEHGKGFAVVAAEVRKLAERSQVAAQEIGELATGSVDKAESAGKLLGEMVPAISKTSDLVQEITAASEEQSAGVGQINAAMSQLNQITQQNASASEELAATAEEMNGQAQQLKSLMTFFKVGSEDTTALRAAAPAVHKKARSGFDLASRKPKLAFAA